MSAPLPKHPATAPAPIAGDTGLVARVFDLCADLLRNRAGTKADDLAVLQRLNADLLAEFAARARADAAPRISMPEAALAARCTTQTVRNWIRRQADPAYFSRDDSGKYRLHEPGFRAFLASRRVLRAQKKPA